MAGDPTYERLGLIRAPDAATAEALPEQAVIVPGPGWPDRAVLRQHAEYHAAPGAVPENRGRQCPMCMTLLWDANNEAYGPHTVEKCEWNAARSERDEAREATGRRRPKTGHGAPNIMEIGF